MEAILIVIVVAIGWILFRMLLSSGFRTLGAVAKSAVGKGTLSENMSLAFKGMGELEIRFQPARFGDDEDGPSFKAVEIKGLLPLSSNTSVGFVTSIFDITDDDQRPVLGAIDVFQEPDTIAYQHVTDVGTVGPDQGFVSWVRVGAVVPELLIPPQSGRRKFRTLIRLVDMRNMPSIELGMQNRNDPGVLWVGSLEFVHVVEDKGYEEAAEHRDRASALSIKIGMAVAMADGSLDYAEGDVLKEWIIKKISPFPDEKQNSLKSVYNSAMSEAYDEAQSGELSLSQLTEELNSIAEKATRYETIELCFDVMAADGVADAEEMKVIRKIAEALDLDFEEIEKMRDIKIVGLDSSLSGQSSIEDLLGIEEDWDVTKIKKHLRVEFQKWNNRLNTLDEGGERENAQRMLNLIADARKKYA